jgi:hypothetical protein
MSTTKHLMSTGVATVLVTGGLLVGTPSTASANDDTRTVSGSCSRQSNYEFRLSDHGGELRKQRMKFAVNSKKDDGRSWRIRVYRDGDKIWEKTKETGDRGNVTFWRTFVADDDADIRVVAKAGYGERCERKSSLD